jgi:hypothetical protein
VKRRLVLPVKVTPASGGAGGCTGTCKSPFQTPSHHWSSLFVVLKAVDCGCSVAPIAGRVELLLVLNCQCHQGPLPVYHCHYTPLVYKPGSIHRDMRFISRPITHTYPDSIQLKPGSLQRWNTEEELTTRRWDPKQTCTHSNILRTSCAR